MTYFNFVRALFFFFGAPTYFDIFFSAFKTFQLNNVIEKIQ